jgi:hypothetical protein
LGYLFGCCSDCGRFFNIVVALKPLVGELKTNSTIKGSGYKSIQTGSKNQVDSRRQRPGRQPVCTIQPLLV